jgi:hypothetical protein
MSKIEIHNEVTKDFFVVVIDENEDVQESVDKEIAKMGWNGNDCWIWEIK